MLSLILLMMLHIFLQLLAVSGDPEAAAAGIAETPTVLAHTKRGLSHIPGGGVITQVKTTLVVSCI